MLTNLNLKMEINEKKLKRQLIGVDKYFKSGQLGLSHKDRVGCFNYFTGVGKTYTAILAMKRYFKSNDNVTFTILLPNDTLLKQWNIVLNNNFTKTLLKRVKLVTADYMITNNIIINTDVLIVDELDAFYSEKRIKLLDKTYIRYVDVLGLTATYEDSRDRHLKVKPFIPVIDKIDEKEALKEGYISKYIEYNLGLSFSEEEQLAHDKYSEEIKSTLSKFGKGGLHLAGLCLSGGKTKKGMKITSTQACQMYARDMGYHPKLNPNNPTHSKIIDLWHPNKIFYYAINAFKAIRKRKELIYTNSAKLDATIKLLEKYANTKTVVFSQSTDFANVVYGIINQKNPDNAVIYHSKVESQYYPSPKTGKLIKFGKKRLKDRAMDRINKGLSNHLITSSALDKGLDIPSLKMGITTSGTQNPTQATQRGGRVKRVDTSNSDSVSILVNLYIRDSKETDWLRNRQSKNSNIVYWIDDVSEISYKPKTNNINIKDI